MLTLHLSKKEKSGSRRAACDSLEFCAFPDLGFCARIRACVLRISQSAMEYRIFKRRTCQASAAIETERDREREPERERERERKDLTSIQWTFCEHFAKANRALLYKLPNGSIVLPNHALQSCGVIMLEKAGGRSCHCPPTAQTPKPALWRDRKTCFCSPNHAHG